jgi:hypothetical protein
LLDCFRREREAVLTGLYRFDVNQITRKAMTILGDLLFSVLPNHLKLVFSLSPGMRL